MSGMVAGGALRRNKAHNAQIDQQAADNIRKVHPALLLEHGKQGALTVLSQTYGIHEKSVRNVLNNKTWARSGAATMADEQNKENVNGLVRNGMKAAASLIKREMLHQEERCAAGNRGSAATEENVDGLYLHIETAATSILTGCIRKVERQAKEALEERSFCDEETEISVFNDESHQTQVSAGDGPQTDVGSEEAGAPALRDQLSDVACTLQVVLFTGSTAMGERCEATLTPTEHRPLLQDTIELSPIPTSATSSDSPQEGQEGRIYQAAAEASVLTGNAAQDVNVGALLEEERKNADVVRTPDAGAVISRPRIKLFGGFLSPLVGESPQSRNAAVAPEGDPRCTLKVSHAVMTAEDEGAAEGELLSSFFKDSDKEGPENASSSLSYTSSNTSFDTSSTEVLCPLSV